MAEGVEAEALQAGYDVLLLRARGEPGETGLRSLRERRVDALIALGQTAETGAKAWRDAPVPPVVIQAFGPAGLPSVGLDSRPGIDAAVAHLAELGHRQLLWIGPSRAVGHRGNVVAACAESHGLAAMVRDIEEVIEPDSGPEGQIAFWQERLSKALPDLLPATAVFCWNDRAALGLYAVLRQRGLRVPEDVSVVGFDDHEAALALPPLSTVSHEFRQMGAEAARLAMRLADGSLSRNAAAETTIRVPSRFVERKSTGPAP
jgi:DNA-binding LacI/PurR family transcriptional regulator